MRKLHFTLLLLALTTYLYGQRRIDLVTLKTIVTDKNSAFFYDSLVEKFIRKPNSFEQSMAVRLYYGKLFSKYYKLYKVSDEEKEFNKYLKQNRYKKAIPIGESILKTDPVNLEIGAKLLNAYLQEKIFEKTDSLQARVNVLMKAVKYSGTGDDEGSPIKVVSVGDEYAIMGLMGYAPLQRSSIMKQSSTIDSWVVRDVKTRSKFNLCFEVIINLDAMPNFDN